MKMDLLNAVRMYIAQEEMIKSEDICASLSPKDSEKEATNAHQCAQVLQLLMMGQQPSIIVLKVKPVQMKLAV